MERYQLKLGSLADNEVVFLKALRLVGKLSLADAVDIHAYAKEHPGTVLVAGIDRAIAERVGAHFTEAGIAVVVEPSSMTTPMICAPLANVAFRERALRMGFAVDESPDQS